MSQSYKLVTLAYGRLPGGDRYQTILVLEEINVNKYLIHLLVKRNRKVLDSFSLVYCNEC